MVCLLRRGGENSGVQTRRMLQSWSVYSDGAEKTVEYRRGACSHDGLFTPTGRRKQWSTDAAHAQTRFR
ncbi:unnamed protein product [Sphagnum jensenii]|uniref:Uncharacterized protein n=1 Tax=Sphagnum jensenii TaxID=128206 RepID=A0ABP0W767_9BRYO